MQKHFIILILLCLQGCKNEQAVKTTGHTQAQTQVVVKDSIPTAFSISDYTLAYQYSEGNDQQTLGINVVDGQTLQFHLTTKTLPCDTDYWGQAVNKNAEGDGEVDSDAEGGYFAIEYLKEDTTYLLGIRLAEDSSKVQIKYITKDSLDTDCRPLTERIMNRIK